MKIQRQNNLTALVIDRRSLNRRNQARLMLPINRVVEEILQIDGVWLAGGSLRAVFDETPVKDYDLFFRDEAAKYNVKTLLTALGAKITFICPQGSLMNLTLGNTHYQLITPRFYQSAFDLIGSFDFTVTQFCFDGRQFVLGLDGIKDAKYKLLKLHAIEFPVATMNRIAKYRQKDYFMPEDEWRKLFFVIKHGQFDERQMALYID